MLQRVNREMLQRVNIRTQLSMPMNEVSHIVIARCCSSRVTHGALGDSSEGGRGKEKAVSLSRRTLSQGLGLGLAGRGLPLAAGPSLTSGERERRARFAVAPSTPRGREGIEGGQLAVRAPCVSASQRTPACLASTPGLSRSASASPPGPT